MNLLTPNSKPPFKPPTDNIHYFVILSTTMRVQDVGLFSMGVHDV